MVLSINLFEESFVRIVTITFTALILSELLNVITTIHQMNRYILFSILITIVIYGLSLALFRNYLDTSEIDIDFFWKVGVIVGISWGPVFLGRCLIRKIAPSE